MMNIQTLITKFNVFEHDPIDAVICYIYIYIYIYNKSHVSHVNSMLWHIESLMHTTAQTHI